MSPSYNDNSKVGTLENNSLRTSKDGFYNYNFKQMPNEVTEASDTNDTYYEVFFI